MAATPLTSKLVGLAITLGGLLWMGYQRRRDGWTRQSWRRFGLLLALALAMMAVALRMALGVDEGVYRGMAPLWRRVYFYAMTTLLVGGAVGAVGLVFWFARGDADRPLGRDLATASPRMEEG